MIPTQTTRISSQRYRDDVNDALHLKLHGRLLEQARQAPQLIGEDRMPNKVQSAIDSCMKLAVIAGIATLSYLAVNEMKSAQILANQSNAINSAFLKLKELNNADVDKIIGVKR